MGLPGRATGQVMKEHDPDVRTIRGFLESSNRKAEPWERDNPMLS
jgi:hypothetical protein